MGYVQVKRGLDVVGAVLALLLLSPVMAVIALLVLIFHGAPVIFVQQRVTQGERIFRLRKFRSMRAADPERGRVSDEERLTAFGRLLRSTSLDELPSLWNILVGDMSVIGPRPLTTDYLCLYTEQQARRHDVRAGLSGLSQVSGRNCLDWDDKFDLDVRYVETMSLALDLRILLRTVTTVLRRQGVTKDHEATSDSYGGTLRSDLVVFRQVPSVGPVRSWSVETAGGRPVGRCQTLAVSERARMIRFDPAPAPAPDLTARSHATTDAAVFAEVLRLVVNRVRSANADFAVCSLSSINPEQAKAYASAGFRPLTAELIPTVMPLAEFITDEQIFLYCVLYDDVLQDEVLHGEAQHTEAQHIEAQHSEVLTDESAALQRMGMAS
jgi:lipopolysaccharide/colanic/teichoic acid biosynthesis glycosyltransferase